MNQYFRLVAMRLGCGAMALWLSACASTPKPARSGDEVSPHHDRHEMSSSPTQIVIAAEIRDQCVLPDGPTEVPRFAFDESQLRSRGIDILDAVAECLKRGPLAGQTVTIVGRADPRGTVAYNQALGSRRARSAGDYLTRQGVPSAGLELMSRGELDAAGHDEETWAFDRRVDFELAQDDGDAASSLEQESSGVKGGTSWIRP